MDTPVEIMLGTLVVCLALSRSRLSLVLPYAIVASQLTSYLDWLVTTLFLFMFMLLDKAISGVMHD